MKNFSEPPLKISDTLSALWSVWKWPMLLENEAWPSSEPLRTPSKKAYLDPST